MLTDQIVSPFKLLPCGAALSKPTEGRAAAPSGDRSASPGQGGDWVHLSA